MQLNTFKRSKGSSWKLGFKPFWRRQPSQGVPWWAQVLLCSMQTDRKASWGMGYFMATKFFHVNYQIISCQSKSLSTPFLRHSPNRPKTRRLLHFLCSVVSCARWMFSSSKQMGFINEKKGENETILISCLFLVFHVRNTGLKITLRTAFMQKGTLTPHKTVTRLVLPSPPNPSENAGYLFYHHHRSTSQPWLPATVVQYVLFRVAESKKK